MILLDDTSFLNARVTRHIHRVLCLLFLIGSSALYLVASSRAGTRGTSYIAIHAFLTVLMFGALFTSRDRDSKTHVWTLKSGLLARMILIGVPAFTTTDVQRYLWDGFVALAGLDPYRVSPDVAVVQIAGVWPKPISSANYVTIYPPGALALYTFCATFGPKFAFWIWKLLVTGASTATLLLVWKLLRSRRCERYLPLAAFSPLLILESGVGAHVDVFCGLCVAGALLAFERRTLLISGVLLGIGGLIKFLPLAMIVPMVLSERKKTIRFVMAAMTTTLLGYAAALTFGLHPLGSLVVFFEKWRFGAPLYSMFSFFFPRSLSRAFAFFTGLIFCVAVYNKERSPKIVCFLSLPLLVSPVVFPWYLTPVVVVATVYPSIFIVLWATTMPFTYEVIDRFDSAGIWRTAHWPLWVISTGWMVGLVIDWLRANHSTNRALMRWMNEAAQGGSSSDRQRFSTAGSSFKAGMRRGLRPGG